MFGLLKTTASPRMATRLWLRLNLLPVRPLAMMFTHACVRMTPMVTARTMLSEHHDPYADALHGNATPVSGAVTGQDAPAEMEVEI